MAQPPAGHETIVSMYGIHYTPALNPLLGENPPGAFHPNTPQITPIRPKRLSFDCRWFLRVGTKTTVI